jgi:EAL domain-containing protein (putative c-di-GMP-specific phosphodiesterase class I)
VIDELVTQLSDQRRRQEGRRQIRDRIERALSDPDALHMVFQPIWQLTRDKIIGREALARFSNGIVQSPEQWFADADEVGLREELELLAVSLALDQLDALGPDEYLAVNASPSTIESAGFHVLVAGSAPERVVVEITEHAPIDDYESVTEAFDQVRSLGVRLAIDDAGAGFASMRHVLRLDPDFIKLDISLIAGIDTDSSKQALASGLISVAESAGATILAEGIERDEELETLVGLGVEYGQGYLLARPGPLSLGR